MTEGRGRRPQATVVLAAEDPDVRLALRLHLEGTFEITGEAASNAEAVLLGGALQPHVVVLDLEVTSLEAIPAMRRAAPRARIVALSGREAREEALVRGAHAHVLKPFDAETLVDAMAAAMR